MFHAESCFFLANVFDVMNLFIILVTFDAKIYVKLFDLKTVAISFIHGGAVVAKRSSELILIASIADALRVRTPTTTLP
jgi:hypothetical protein